MRNARAGGSCSSAGAPEARPAAALGPLPGDAGGPAGEQSPVGTARRELSVSSSCDC